jgi:hypothetical protein
VSLERLGEGRGDLLAGLAQPRRRVRRRGGVTAKPGPPKAVTTTPAVVARPVAISPAVVQPISGVPGAWPEIAASSYGRS